ncbi:MAG: peptidoglycan D,D-transpeptidase FtsI family protein [Chloroflexota bacterium]
MEGQRLTRNPHDEAERAAIGRQQAIYRVAVIVAVGVTLLLGRLAYWQIFRASALGQEASRQWLAQLPTDIPRGRILDAHLTPLTDPRQSRAVVAFPALVKDRSAVATAIARLTGASRDTISARLASDAPAVRVVSGVSADVAAQVEAARLPGILVMTEHVRYGPNALASHVVGYINYANRGVSGIEQQFDDQLRGGPAGMANVVLTIDAGIQRAVEDVVRRSLTKGAVVVLDVASGDILAMASAPSFDQRQPENSLNAGDSPFINRALSGLGYPPGSTFKLVTAAAALERGLVAPTETFVCPGFTTVGRLTFDCHARDRGGHGILTMREALAQSCNVAFIQIAQRVGAEALLEMAGRLGFGVAAGTGLPGESAGNLPQAKDVHAGDLANTALGQGQVLATPLQVARMMNIIANGGVDPGVRLVRELRDGNGLVLQRTAAPTPRRVLDQAVAAELQASLRAATDHGTGVPGFVPGYGSAGKTGSAEASIDGRDAVDAWFVGYAPEFGPKYVICVLAEEGVSGGQSAAPIFRDIMTRILD